MQKCDHVRAEKRSKITTATWYIGFSLSIVNLYMHKRMRNHPLHVSNSTKSCKILSLSCMCICRMIFTLFLIICASLSNFLTVEIFQHNTMVIVKTMSYRCVFVGSLINTLIHKLSL